MSEAVTEWISGGTNPTIVGVYERRLRPSLRFSYWNGDRWGVSEPTAELAAKYGALRGIFQEAQWRGLKPKSA